MLFAAEGARVVVNDLGGDWDGSGADPGRLHGWWRRSATARPCPISMTSPSLLADLLQLALETWGWTSSSVNAGILRDRMVFNMPVEDWDAVMKVHLRGHS